MKSRGRPRTALFGLEKEPTGYRQVAKRFFAAAMEEGVYFHYGWHHGLPSAHTPADIDQALEGIAAAAQRVVRG